MRVKPSAPIIWLAVLAVLAAGGLIYSATREGPLVEGALQVSPSALTLTGSERSPLTVRNVGPTTITVAVTVTGNHPVLVRADPASVVVRPGADRVIEVRQAGRRTTAPVGDIREPMLVVSSGPDRLDIPLTLRGEVPPIASGGLTVDEPEVDFPAGVSAVTRTITNAGAEVTTWSSAPPSWLQLRPSGGSLDPGESVVVRMEVNRSRLTKGVTAGRLPIRSSVGRAEFEVTVTTTADPIISLPSPTLDFNVGGQLTVRTLTFEVRNIGKGDLRYQASVDRAFLKLGEGASGTLRPGETADVSLTFDFRETKTSYEWEAEVPITSNGGSAVLRVIGESDWSGPTLTPQSNQMDFAHDHCDGGSCRRFRHLRFEAADPRNVTVSEAAYQVCTGSGPQPSCEDWKMAPKGRRVSGTPKSGVYEFEIGPLPSSCVPGVGVIVRYRLRLADSLKNVVLRPGSSTYYGHPHCSRAD